MNAADVAGGIYFEWISQGHVMKRHEGNIHSLIIQFRPVIRESLQLRLFALHCLAMSPVQLVASTRIRFTTRVKRRSINYFIVLPPVFSRKCILISSKVRDGGAGGAEEDKLSPRRRITCFPVVAFASPAHPSAACRNARPDGQHRPRKVQRHICRNRAHHCTESTAGSLLQEV